MYLGLVALPIGACLIFGFIYEILWRILERVSRKER